MDINIFKDFIYVNVGLYLSAYISHNYFTPSLLLQISGLNL